MGLVREATVVAREGDTMRTRSWMAALAIAAASVCAVRAGEAVVENKVTLELQISGLGPQGCHVEIKPGHPGCQFKPVSRSVEPETVRDVVKLDPISLLARSSGADRDCSFAITITEPGLPARTFHRGVRLSAPGDARTAPVHRLKCYLSSPSLVARDERGKARH
jgi:hypothetical protein